MEWIIKKPIFHWYLIYFLSEAVEASRCHFFENWLMKHKCTNLLKPLGTINQWNYWFFYPLELIYFALFNMRHPVHPIFNKRCTYLDYIVLNFIMKYHSKILQIEELVPVIFWVNFIQIGLTDYALHKNMYLPTKIVDSGTPWLILSRDESFWKMPKDHS